MAISPCGPCGSQQRLWFPMCCAAGAIRGSYHGRIQGVQPQRDCIWIVSFHGEDLPLGILERNIYVFVLFIIIQYIYIYAHMYTKTCIYIRILSIYHYIEYIDGAWQGRTSNNGGCSQSNSLSNTIKKELIMSSLGWADLIVVKMSDWQIGSTVSFWILYWLYSQSWQRFHAWFTAINPGVIIVCLFSDVFLFSFFLGHWALPILALAPGTCSLASLHSFFLMFTMDHSMFIVLTKMIIALLVVKRNCHENHGICDATCSIYVFALDPYISWEGAKKNTPVIRPRSYFRSKGTGGYIELPNHGLDFRSFEINSYCRYISGITMI